MEQIPSRQREQHCAKGLRKRDQCMKDPKKCGLEGRGPKELDRQAGVRSCRALRA